MSAEGRVLERRPLVDRLRRRFHNQLRQPFQARVLAPLRQARNRRREYQPIFVTGAIGSGTTLLAFSLGQRFDCACVIEESALQISRKSFLYVPHPDLFASIREYRQSFTADASWSPERGRRDLMELYRSYASGPSDVVFDKGPNANLLRVAFLDRCFPTARFVMIFRDPVANIEGFLRKWKLFGGEPISESIRFYREIHERFLDAVAGLGDRVTIIEYEDLVEHYESMMELLRDRLGVDPSTRMRRLHDRANVEGTGIRNVVRGRIGVVRTDGPAHQRLGAETAQLIVAQLGPLHERMRALASRVG
jgi:hypothetical protein